MPGKLGAISRSPALTGTIPVTRSAAVRVTTLQGRGEPSARLYGESPDDGVGGFGSFFLLLDDPEVYGLPPDPVDTTRDLGSMWRSAGAAALGLVGAAFAAAVLGHRR